MFGNLLRCGYNLLIKIFLKDINCVENKALVYLQLLILFLPLSLEFYFLIMDLHKILS
jgi:hypothetical protein